MATYDVRFERIGRGHRETVATFDAETADDLAAAVYRHCKGKLASRWFDVTVDLDAGTGGIDGGRFGAFTVEEVAP